MNLKVTEHKHLSAPEQVTSRYNGEQKLKIAEAAKGFESLLTSMMLKSMMSSSEGGMFGEGSMGGDYFETIFQSEISNHISGDKGMGVAELLFKKLTGEDMSSALKNIEKSEEVKLKPPAINSEKIKEDKTEAVESVSLKNVNSNSIAPSNKSLERLEKYEDIINEVSKTYGIDKNLIKSVILTESAAKNDAISSAKAKGLMQLIDPTAKAMGVRNIWDPKENIHGGTKYLSKLLRQYNGNVKYALAGYNAGPGNVDKYNGIPPFKETQNYVVRVLGYYNHLSGSKNEN